MAVLLGVLLPSTAWAQAADAGADPDALQAEVAGDYAQAMASDCGLACRALGSMKRATDRLCALDPGDRCVKARQQLADATDHVRASCPECAVALDGKLSQAKPEEATPAPAEVAMQSESVRSRGGCAGCTTTSTAPDGAVPLAFAALAAWGARRRRRGPSHSTPSAR